MNTCTLPVINATHAHTRALTSRMRTRAHCEIGLQVKYVKRSSMIRHRSLPSESDIIGNSFVIEGPYLNKRFERHMVSMYKST